MPPTDGEEYSGALMAKYREISREVTRDEMARCLNGAEHKRTLEDHERRITDVETKIEDGLKRVYDKLDGINDKREDQKEKKATNYMDWLQLVAIILLGVILKTN